jgi:hypothetical protein
MPLFKPISQATFSTVSAKSGHSRAAGKQAFLPTRLNESCDL